MQKEASQVILSHFLGLWAGWRYIKPGHSNTNSHKVPHRNLRYDPKKVYKTWPKVSAAIWPQLMYCSRGSAGWNRRRFQFQRCSSYYSSCMQTRKLSMQLPPVDIYLLTFDEFHRVTASDGRKYIDCDQFLWGSHQFFL